MSSVIELRDSVRKIQQQFIDDVSAANERAFHNLAAAVQEFIGDGVEMVDSREVPVERKY